MTFNNNYGSKEVICISDDSTADVLFQYCHLIAHKFAITVENTEQKSPHISLRMAENIFNTSQVDTKLIYIDNSHPLSVNWMLWKSWFQIDSFHIESNNTDFNNSTDRIVSLWQPGAFPGTISEIVYASGKFMHQVR